MRAILTFTCATLGALALWVTGCGSGKAAQGTGNEGDAATDGGTVTGDSAPSGADGASSGGATGDASLQTDGTSEASSPLEGGTPGVLPTCGPLATLPVRTPTYFVDFSAGNDTADGKSQATAWKHAPGD